jgi:hypothetical protein
MIPTPIESSQVVESLRLRLPGEIILETDYLVTPENMSDPNELLRIAVRQGIEDQRIHDAEDRRVRPDPQRQREHGDEGEAGVSPHHPQPIPSILKECLDKSDSTHIAMSLL